MKCAIYSSGPSISRAFDNDTGRIDDVPDLRIAINNAINLIPDGFTDIYCAGDPIAYRTQYTTRRPNVCWCCLCEPFRQQIHAMGLGWDKLPSLLWEDLPALKPVSSPSYSITAAIALAARLGARSIVIIGHDAAIGHFNSGGPSHGSMYSPERAAKESKEIAQITSHLQADGVSVTIRT
jgi:hypothetical protein